MNLNDLTSKIICERIKMIQEFLNINHNDLYHQNSSKNIKLWLTVVSMVTTGKKEHR